MMTTVPIILVIVVWLFILAPWLLRSQRPMSHTGEAFEETRVLFEGDSGSVPGRRKPRVGKADVRPRAEAAVEDSDAEYELVLADDPSEDQFNTADAIDGEGEGAETHIVADTIDGEVVESPETATAADSAAAVPVSAESTAANAEAVQDNIDDDGEDDVIVEEEHIEDSDADIEPAEAEVFTAPAHASVADDAFAFDETYTSPVDLLYPGAIDAPAAAEGSDTTDSSADAEDTTESDDAPSSGSAAVPVSEPVDEDDVAENSEDTDTELSAEELAFAQRRLGRGGWDPVKEKEASATRYQRRQRTLIGLAVAVVATVCLGIVLGGWTWWLAAIAGVITTVYLVALRSQVRREQELLRRRVYHLRRARLGVRNADNPAESLPPHLRRPGALVLEIDDESPDFDYLPVYDEDDSDGGFDGPHSSPRQRRDDLAARRVG